MPITMLFAADQAGRSYGRYALDHTVLVESQLRTAELFDFDHVSAITETREAPDCGAAVRYFDDQPYALDESQALLADKRALGALSAPDPYTAAHMSDRLRALSALKQAAGREKIVEGWVEGPCGASADLRGINTLMTDFHDDPRFVTDLFEFVVDLAIRFGRAQVEAGADVIGMGDPAASLVGPKLYDSFVLPYEKKLAEGIHAAGGRVRLHICGNTRRSLASMAAVGADIVDIDSMVPLADARAKMGAGQVLLGNVDPVRTLLNGTPGAVRAAVAECRRAAGPNYIIGAGCEVPRGTPAENLKALREAAS
jgi:MtaA/CmuA family methyltransferase